MRLNKFLAQYTHLSRRKADEAISDGQVSINGEKVITLGVLVDPNKDQVSLKGKPVKITQEFVYVMLNKPKGVLSAVKDEQRNLPTVADMVRSKHRLYPVGRLDKDTTGLILMTNDGDLAYRLTHPTFHIPKTYRAEILGKVRQGALTMLQNGVELDDGMTAPAELEVISSNPRKTVLRLTLYEGRKRQIRRMAAALRLHLLALERLAIGSLQLNELKTGQWRELTTTEVKTLKEETGLA